MLALLGAHHFLHVSRIRVNLLTARLLRSWVRIPPWAWIFVCCECRVLSGRGLCDELITRPETSYRLCCVVVCDLETSRMDAPYIYDISRLRVKRQAIKLRDWCIWLVDLFEYMMMHGLTNPKLRITICIKCKIDHIFKYFHFYLTKIWPQTKAHPCSKTYISPELKSQDSGASKTLHLPWKWRQKRIGPLFAWLVMWVQGLLFLA